MKVIHSVYQFFYLNIYLSIFLVPTKITKAPKHWHLVPGEPVVFDCEGESDPSTPVRISWYRDGQPINLDKPEFTMVKTNEGVRIKTRLSHIFLKNEL